MKLHLLAGTAFFLIMVGCAHTDTKKPDDGMNKTSSDSQEASCVPPPGKDKCVTGGGPGGPILED